MWWIYFLPDVARITGSLWKRLWSMRMIYSKICKEPRPSSWLDAKEVNYCWLSPSSWYWTTTFFNRWQSSNPSNNCEQQLLNLLATSCSFWSWKFATSCSSAVNSCTHQLDHLQSSIQLFILAPLHLVMKVCKVKKHISVNLRKHQPQFTRIAGNSPCVWALNTTLLCSGNDTQKQRIKIAGTLNSPMPDDILKSVSSSST